jgi:hypothetical protein
VRVHASGALDAVRLAYVVNEAADKGLKRELDRGSRDAVKTIVDEVRENPRPYIPQGFEEEFIASLQHRASVRLLQQRTIEAVFWAMGRGGHRRKIDVMDEGILRHPVFGRTRPLTRHWIHKATTMVNPWVDQPIRPGVITEPGRASLVPASRKLDDAVARVVEKINRG